jgi:hypothetical protein
MAISTELDVANRALVRLGAQPITALDEATDRARACAAEIEETRKETLRAYPWNFSHRRARLSTFPAAQLTPGTGADVDDTEGVTFTADAAVFEVGRDEGERILGPTGAARIVSVTSTTVVVADIETAFEDVSTIAEEDWRIAPSWNWGFRYTKPSGYLRLIEMQGTNVRNNGSTVWSWWRDLNNTEEPVKIEGRFLVSDQGGKINVKYTEDITDLTRWDSLALSAYSALLAFRIAYAVTGSLQVAKTQHDAFKEILGDARTADGQEGSIDDSGSSILLDVRW